jgi:cysteine desulfurase
MFANNEIGTIQPIQKLAEVARAHGVLFHTDAVQAFGQIPIDAKDLGIDFLSASSHKLYGPKGVGCLYIREGLELPPLLFGGAQEHGMRAGTENTAGIVGFGAAAACAATEMEKNAKQEQKLRDSLIEQVLSRIPYSRLNGSIKDRLPGNANFAFQFIEGATLLIMLDMKGICASAGSACTASSHAPSHVLKAIGLPDDLARGSLRLTLGRETTQEEIDVVVDSLEEILMNLRSMSEEYADITGQS